MPLVRIDTAGSIGMVTDVPAYELPPEAWTTAVNVRCESGRVYKTQGSTLFVDPPTVTPYYVLNAVTPVNNYWIYAGLAKVYVTDGTSHYNITRQSGAVDVDYTGSANDIWTGCVLNGIPIINNGVDAPQVWNPVNTSTKLAELTGWSTMPTGSSTRCGAIRPYRTYMLAMDVTESSVRDPYAVIWSHPADVGTVPSSWDYSDPTKDAGKVSLADTPGFVLDSCQMDRINVIYKEDATYAMQLIGGTYVFRFDKALGATGMLAKNCVCQIKDKHFLVTQDDIIVHDLSQKQSVLTSRMRRRLFGIDSIINPAYQRNCFVLPNYKRNEAWFFYPTAGSQFPNRALIYNWDSGALTDRELTAPAIAGGVGIVDVTTADRVWDNLVGKWEAQQWVWDARNYDPTYASMLVANSTTHLTQLDVTEQFNGSNMTSYVERTGLSIVGRDRQGQWKSDPNTIKYVRRVIPLVQGNASINVYVGAQDDKDGPVSWEGPHVFNPNMDQEILTDTTGRFLAIRFESVGDQTWKLDGYILDIELVGGYYSGD